MVPANVRHAEAALNDDILKHGIIIRIGLSKYIPMFLTAVASRTECSMKVNLLAQSAREYISSASLSNSLTNSSALTTVDWADVEHATEGVFFRRRLFLSPLNHHLKAGVLLRDMFGGH